MKFMTKVFCATVFLMSVYACQASSGDNKLFDYEPTVFTEAGAVYLSMYGPSSQPDGCCVFIKKPWFLTSFETKFELRGSKFGKTINDKTYRLIALHCEKRRLEAGVRATFQVKDGFDIRNMETTITDEQLAELEKMPRCEESECVIS
jgi:hypothetical protein